MTVITYAHLTDMKGLISLIHRLESGKSAPLSSHPHPSQPLSSPTSFHPLQSPPSPRSPRPQPRVDYLNPNRPSKNPNPKIYKFHTDNTAKTQAITVSTDPVPVGNLEDYERPETYDKYGNWDYTNGEEEKGIKREDYDRMATNVAVRNGGFVQDSLETESDIGKILGED